MERLIAIGIIFVGFVLFGMGLRLMILQAYFFRLVKVHEPGVWKIGEKWGAWGGKFPPLQLFPYMGFIETSQFQQVEEPRVIDVAAKLKKVLTDL